MDNIFFYPRLTESMLEEAGTRVSEYEFTYKSPFGEYNKLELSGNRTKIVGDPADVWQLRKDGIIVEKTLVIEYPEKLRGSDGVAPQNARIAPCILWTNSKLSTAGVIFPEEMMERPRLACRFREVFEPGTLAGDITLDLVLYVSSKADVVLPGEEILMNEPGVHLGSIEMPLTVDFDGDSMDFPIEEYEDQDGPLWRMQFEPWADPREDLFSDSSFILLLNTKHPDCPKISNGVVSQFSLLVEVLCEAYFLIFEHVREFQDGSAWNDMISDSNLSEGSICSVLHWFSQRGEEPFDWSSPESRMLSIKRIVDQCFVGGDDFE